MLIYHTCHTKSWLKITNQSIIYLFVRAKNTKNREARYIHLDQLLLNILNAQSQMATQLLIQTNIESVLSPKQLLVWTYLEKVTQTTPKQISTGTGVPRPTINQILNKLLGLKLIERIGQGSTTRYRKV